MCGMDNLSAQHMNERRKRMEPEMTILECIGQVVVFWAVCLVGWVAVKVIERRNRAAKLSHKCRKDAAEVSHKCRKETGRRAA